MPPYTYFFHNYEFIYYINIDRVSLHILHVYYNYG